MYSGGKVWKFNMLAQWCEEDFKTRKYSGSDDPDTRTGG